jgi:lipopolysaccharide transport system permease protein
MSAKPKPLIVIDAARASRPIVPADFWDYRGLLCQMIVSAFRAKYLQFRGSFLLYYARPLAITLIFVYLRLGAGVELGHGAPYPLFVLTGVCFWFIFADATLAASNALARDAGLIQKVYFPILILPLAQVLARFADVGLALLAVAALQIWLGVGVDLELLMLVPVIVQMMLLALGLGCAIAAVSLALPDIREGVTIALMLGLFISPVFYAPERMSPAAQAVLNFNPMVGTLEALRGALFATDAFPWAAWGYSCAFTAVVLVGGLTLLGRASRNVAEFL